MSAVILGKKEDGMRLGKSACGGEGHQEVQSTKNAT
jgi:hypothetical protein